MEDLITAVFVNSQESWASPAGGPRDTAWEWWSRLLENLAGRGLLW